MKFKNSLINCYKKLSPIGKLLILTGFFLIIIIFFKYIEEKKNRENFENNKSDQNEKIVFKDGNNIYDDFYAEIYDHLVFNNLKNNYEISSIIDVTNINKDSNVVDIGSGTGHHIKEFADKGINAVGIDISPAMIKVAKLNYPKLNFKVGDALDAKLFQLSSFTHITCFYFTFYYFKDKTAFFHNCMDWLKPGGYLILHLVNRETFDPILPPGNPLLMVSPQKYAKERITHTKVTFTNFVYKSEFNLNATQNLATFDEKFNFNNGKIRKQQHKFYMQDIAVIANTAQENGFILKEKINLIKCAYDNQFLYIFVKPG